MDKKRKEKKDNNDDDDTLLIQASVAVTYFHFTSAKENTNKKPKLSLYTLTLSVELQTSK